MSLVDRVDDLYRTAILDAPSVDDMLLADWSQSVADSTDTGRAERAAVRKALGTARKLAKYWSERDPGVLPDWRNGVDEALGGLGWKAQLMALEAALEREPDPTTFELLKERHRAVHFTEWMEGVDYEEWMRSRSE